MIQRYYLSIFLYYTPIVLSYLLYIINVDSVTKKMISPGRSQFLRGFVACSQRLFQEDSSWQDTLQKVRCNKKFLDACASYVHFGLSGILPRLGNNLFLYLCLWFGFFNVFWNFNGILFGVELWKVLMHDHCYFVKQILGRNFLLIVEKY